MTFALPMAARQTTFCLAEKSKAKKLVLLDKIWLRIKCKEIMLAKFCLALRHSSARRSASPTVGGRTE